MMVPYQSCATYSGNSGKARGAWRPQTPSIALQLMVSRKLGWFSVKQVRVALSLSFLRQVPVKWGHTRVVSLGKGNISGSLSLKALAEVAIYKTEQSATNLNKAACSDSLL